MALPMLPAGLLKDVCEHLGPGCSLFRATCHTVKMASEQLDVVEEILKWHCVNGTLLLLSPVLLNTTCIEHLGPLPLRCILCKQVNRTRHKYRFIRRPQDTWGFSSGERGKCYVCGVCTFHRLREFLQSGAKFVKGFIGPVVKAQLIKDLAGRVRLKGFMGDVFASNRELGSHMGTHRAST